MTAPRHQADELATFYGRHQRHLEWIVARHVRTSGTIVEDACQTAWTILCARPDVSLHDQSALRWLVTTATREAWKRSKRITRRETPAGGFLPAPAAVAPELPEPAGDSPDPCELAIAHDEHAQRVAQLRRLNERERFYLCLQALGYGYKEMAKQTGASQRTVERQILRAHGKLRQHMGG